MTLALREQQCRTVPGPFLAQLIVQGLVECAHRAAHAGIELRAGEKKGDERKAFMKECLSAKKVTQQDKMKSCNKDAEGKKGDERKAFMKDCLSK